ncbi:MAG: hypothetical protein II784_03390, partial [Oscillospiraceae bacterium]|nr:hypothetical protein [Oscillospiraceae bacterium]
MSASKEKRKRLEALQQGPDKKDLQLQEEAKSKKQFRAKVIIAVVVIVLVLAFVVLFNTNLLYKTVTAAVVDGEKYTVADMNYWFGVSKLNFQSKYGDYISYFFDPSISLKKQVYDEETGKTWHKYFVEASELSVRNITALLNAAEEAGYQFTEEDYKNAENALASIDYASMGYSSLNNYLQAIYGKGVTKSVYLKNTQKLYLASKYSDVVNEGFNLTDEDYRAYYDEHAEEYDFITYYMYYVEAEKGEDGSISESALAASKAAAEDIAAASSIENFSERILKYCPEEKADVYRDLENESFRFSYRASGISTTFADWLTDESRVPGDTTTIEMQSGCYALYYADKGGNDYITKDIRLISFIVDTSKTGDALETAWNNAATSAEGIYQSFMRISEELDAEAAEEEFKNFVGSYSAENTDTDGLIENVSHGMYTKEMEDWIFSD